MCTARLCVVSGGVTKSQVGGTGGVTKCQVGGRGGVTKSQVGGRGVDVLTWSWEGGGVE